MLTEIPGSIYRFYFTILLLFCCIFIDLLHMFMNHHAPKKLSIMNGWNWVCTWFMMMIAFITFKSSLVPLLEGLWSSNSWEFEVSGFRRKLCGFGICKVTHEVSCCRCNVVILVVCAAQHKCNPSADSGSSNCMLYAWLLVVAPNIMRCLTRPQCLVHATVWPKPQHNLQCLVQTLSQGQRV